MEGWRHQVLSKVPLTGLLSQSSMAILAFQPATCIHGHGWFGRFGLSLCSLWCSIVTVIEFQIMTGKSPYEDTNIDNATMRRIVEIPLSQVDGDSYLSDCLEVGT